uniref:CSON007676 protein n=1 Tax=Culicoides sonorensis TaxID=179676 RepID=A0A336M1Y4_CULSO
METERSPFSSDRTIVQEGHFPVRLSPREEFVRSRSPSPEIPSLNRENVSCDKSEVTDVEKCEKSEEKEIVAETPVSVPSDPLDSSAKYRKYSNMVLKAAKEGKIFQVMYFFDVGRIKEELRNRGYIESLAHLFHTEEQQLPLEQLLELAEDGNEYERALLARLVGNYPPDYLWVPMPCYYHTFMNTPMLNKIYIRECDFGLKDGLCDLVAKLNENALMVDTDVKYPRSYVAYRRKEVEEFQSDFKFTTAANLLFYLYEHDIFEMFSDEGTIDQNTLDVLFKVILMHIKNCIEKRPNMPFTPEEYEWTRILKAANDIIKNGAKIKSVGEDFDIIRFYGGQVKFCAGEIMRVWPNRQFDGIKNVWLLKPAYSGQGYDIVLSDNEETIMSYVNNLKRRYIIQKYIEKPLLIHGHKFDIRQYFLVTIEDNELTAFSHPMASFKFASQPFSLDTFHEAVHITNSSIQQKYIASRYDESPLPRDHLWSIIEFKDYLTTIGLEHAWEELIYPQMKRALIAITVGSLPYIDLKPGRFELFGCDWIITDNFQVYLLEINYAPGLGYITPVSKVVCGTVMEDVVKVTVDWVKDRTASTGGFEIIYRTPIYKTLNSRYVNAADEEKRLSGRNKSATATWIKYIHNPTPIP